jgi:hypothetical protein
MLRGDSSPLPSFIRFKMLLHFQIKYKNPMLSIISAVGALFHTLLFSMEKRNVRNYRSLAKYLSFDSPCLKRMTKVTIIISGIRTAVISMEIWINIPAFFNLNVNHPLQGGCLWLSLRPYFISLKIVKLYYTDDYYSIWLVSDYVV